MTYLHPCARTEGARVPESMEYSKCGQGGPWPEPQHLELSPPAPPGSAPHLHSRLFLAVSQLVCHPSFGLPQHTHCPSPLTCSKAQDPRRTGEMRAENTQQVVSAEHGRKIESSLDGRKVPWSPQFHHQIPDTLSPIFLSVLTGLNMPASKATLRIEQQGQQ